MSLLMNIQCITTTTAIPTSILRDMDLVMAMAGMEQDFVMALGLALGLAQG